MFSYVNANGFLYRLPALLKFFLLVLVEVAVCLTPIWVSVMAILFSFVLALSGGLRLRFFLKDLKSAVFYALFIFVIDALSFLIAAHTFKGYTPGENSITLSVRLFVLVCYTSLFFRTTSSFEMLSSLETLEAFFTRGKTSYVFSKCISLFLSFIPLLFSLWGVLSLSYKIRGRKGSVSKILTLFPPFITRSIYKANDKLLSLQNREE